jgi:hypothetical protein
LEWHVIIRQLNRVIVDAAAQPDRAGGARGQLDRARGAAGQDGGSDVAVMTAERILGHHAVEPLQLELSCRTDGDGNQIISVTGELDIATAEQAYTYISDVIDALRRFGSGRPGPDRPARPAGRAPAQAHRGASAAAEDHADHRTRPRLP